MNSILTIFDFNGASVRTNIVDGEPWWVAKDVCDQLGYVNDSDAIKKHCRVAGVVKRDLSSGGQIREMTLINEGNLLRLVAKSKLPGAVKFESWIFDEVLPSIRKTGSYTATRDPITEVDRVAGSINQLVPALAGRFNEITGVLTNHHERLSQVEEQQRITDPREIEVRMHYLNTCKNLLVFGTKGKPQAISFNGYWGTLKDLIGISSFTNRAALTVPMLEKCIEYAKTWCETRLITPPTLFDEGAG